MQNSSCCAENKSQKMKVLMKINFYCLSFPENPQSFKSIVFYVVQFVNAQNHLFTVGFAIGNTGRFPF
jgi:hypothetical protein